MIERLWNITEALNVLYKDNWTVMANVELIQFQSELTVSLGREEVDEGCPGAGGRRPGGGRDFSLATAFFYCLSLATTVGRAASVLGISLTYSYRLRGRRPGHASRKAHLNRHCLRWATHLPPLHLPRGGCHGSSLAAGVLAVLLLQVQKPW